MRRWGHHRTRSKVALLLVVNLVALLGGKYTAWVALVQSEQFGEALAFAKAPKKTLANPHLSRTPRHHPPPSTIPHQGVTRNRTPRSQPTVWHVIRRGETLSEIAAAYGISLDALRRANRLPSTSYVMVGEALRLPLPEGPVRLTTLPDTFQSSDRTRFLEVQPHIERRTQAPVGARHRFTWPVEGPLTSPFGERDHVLGGGGTQMHAGIDLSVPTGTPVQAAQAGIVVFAGYYGAYGKAVKVDHAQGFSTLYAHNSRVLVQVGQMVKAGQVICVSGSTGRSTGPHLHFEVHKDGWPVDPLPYLY